MLRKARAGTAGDPALPGDAVDPPVRRRPRLAKHRRLLVAAALTLGSVTAITLASGSDPVSADPSPGTTVAASVTGGGATAQFGGDSSQLSGNGRFDVFISRSNLTAEDNGDLTQVYVRDLVANTTVQISQEGRFTGDPPVPSEPVHPSGNPPNGRSIAPTISADGRFVAFITGATNVVPNSGGTSAGFTLVVCDRGAPDSTGGYAVDNAGIPEETCFWVDDDNAGNLNIGESPRLSPDGSHIVWVDNVPACSLEVSCPGRPQEAVSISALTLDSDGSLTGVGTAQMVPATTPDLTVGSGHPSYFSPVVSSQGVAGLGATGVRVAFSAIVPDVTGGPPTLALLETDLPDAGSPTTRVVMQTPATVGYLNIRSQIRPQATASTAEVLGDPSISENGAVVAFDHTQGDVSGANGWYEVPFAPSAYAANFDGTAWQTQPLALDNAGSDHDSQGVPIAAAYPALSGDGRYVAFVTDSRNIDDGPDFVPTPNDGEGTVDDSCQLYAFNYTNAPNQPCQVVARDLVIDASGQLRIRGARVSACANPNLNGCTHNDYDSQNPFENRFDSAGPISLSSDGSKVAFQSQSDALVSDDGNFNSCATVNCNSYDGTDVFVRTWAPTITTTPLDVGSVHVGNSRSRQFTISAADFGPVTVNSVTVGGGDGQFSVDPMGCANVALHETETCSVTITFTPTTTGPANSKILIDTSQGSFEQVVTGTALPALAIKNNDIVRTSVTSGDPGGQAADGTVSTSQVSGNGDYDVFVSDDPLGQLSDTARCGDNQSGPCENVFVRNLRTNKTVEISLGAITDVGDGEPTKPDGSAPDGDSFDPSISADGRFVSFVTQAANIVQIRHDGEGTLTTVVVCDRDPDGDGKFDESQAGHPGRMDYRCYAVEGEYNTDFGGYDAQQPRLSADGTHLVFAHYADYFDGEQPSMRVYQLSTISGGMLDTPQLQDEIRPVIGDMQYVSYSQPVVSNEGLFGGKHSVRVAYDLSGYAGEGYISAIGQTTLTGTSQLDTRIDRVPAPGTGFVGQDPNDDDLGVGDPSITDDGTKVAFSGTDSYEGRATSYVATINKKGGATTQYVGLDKSGTPARAADPAISGDGRYVAYVTDSPQFTGSNAQSAPESSCLHLQGQADLRSQAVDDSTQCQIVARDLVTDASRAKQNLSLMPDALVSESGDQNRCADTPVTVNGGTCSGDDDSLDPSVDRIGSEVGFDSFADDLVANDTNDFNPNAASDNATHVSAQDAFVRSFFPTASLGPVNFGNVLVGHPSSRNVPITINGFGPYQPGTPTIGGTNPGDFTVQPGSCQIPGQVLHRGETCSITITFNPGSTGPRSGTVTVAGQNNPSTTTITVTGNGVNQPPNRAQIAATPDPVSFGSDIPLHKPGRTRTIAVTNTGGQPLVISSVSAIDGTVANTSGDYAIDASDCQPMVAPGATCHISVTWIGKAVGDRQALLRVLDNAPGGMSLIGLQATVPKPRILANPAVSPAGRVTTVTGTGFAPKRTVTIVFTQGGGTESATVKTNKHGAFSTGFVLFPKELVGPRVMHASVDNASKTISAEVPFLIVLGTVESPGLVERH